MILEKINSPTDLEQLSVDELRALAQEIRAEIIDSVSKNGGHLASSLGAVELIIALRKVFPEVTTPIFFDVGHQSYAHKLLSGRRKSFAKLRGIDGCSGFPCPEESPYDPLCEGHSGSAISEALGRATAIAANHGSERAIAVVGDGSLGNGVSLEALNSAKELGSNLLIVLNDNRMAISENVGAIGRYTGKLIAAKRYNRIKGHFLKFLEHLPHTLSVLRRLENTLKHALLPPGVFFETLGIRYFGPVDGHDIATLTDILGKIRGLQGPVVLHTVSQKGHGYEFAEKNPEKFHGVASFEVKTGATPPSQVSFSQVFGQTLTEMAAEHANIRAITAAMSAGTGLNIFAEKYPERFFDVGIAEEHAVAFSAGLATGKLRPVVAVYATFLQRALDCVYSNVALNNLPVIIGIDRFGAVEDGPTHHGIYVLGFLRQIPNLQLLFPADGTELSLMLRYAYTQNSPVAIAYPRGSATNIAKYTPSPLNQGEAVVVKSGRDGVIWALGRELKTALEAAEILEKQNLRLTVVNPRFLSPFDTATAHKFAELPQFTLEDHCVSGGLGATLAQALEQVKHGEIYRFGWQNQIISHGKIADLRAKFGLTATDIARKIFNIISK